MGLRSSIIPILYRRWYEFATAERRTACHLLRRGFFVRREPSFVLGQKPDFLTSVRGRMWVEVKELDPSLSQQLLDLGRRELKHRLAKFSGKCTIDAWLSDGFTDRTAKQVVNLLSREVTAELQVSRHLYVAVPAGELCAGSIGLEWVNRDGAAVRMVAIRSVSNVYGCPPAAEPGNWNSDLQLTDGTNRSRVPAFRVLTAQAPSRVTLRIHPDAKGKGLAMLGTAEAHTVNTVERLRRVIDVANDQLKNAQRYRQLPGVVFVYFDHMGGGDPSDLLRACFGDLAIPLTISPDAKHRSITAGEMFYGLNGAFREGHNTAISAVVYRSRQYSAMSLINPRALYPIRQSWLEGTVYFQEGDRVISTADSNCD